MIRDVAGREVHRLRLNARDQQVVWDTSQAAPGTYTVVLQNKQRQLRAEKLMVRP
ncbi:MAG: hypothetical protein KDC02_23915 [Flavobacteriales bacterium]|nr:hypothetical protein [Flavobacteriales bacterium]